MCLAEAVGMNFFTARSELHMVLFLALSVTFLFVYEISMEALNGFASNSQGRVWSLARLPRSKVKGQGHQGQKRHFRPFRRPACGLCLEKA